jgi:hypothetical protein
VSAVVPKGQLRVVRFTGEWLAFQLLVSGVLGLNNGRKILSV